MLYYGYTLRPEIAEDGTFEILDFIQYLLFGFIIFWGILFSTAFNSILNLTWKSTLSLLVSMIWWILLGLELITYYSL